MKKIEPFYFLIGLAALFVIAGTIFYSARGLSSLKQGDPIEPQICNEKGDLFELWFTGANLLDLSVDRNITGIVFGTDSKKVSLLDRERKLRWEKSFPTSPLQTKISACGNYLAVGTEGGALFFMSTDQQHWWQNELEEPVYLVAISANGKWVLIARGAPEEEKHYLELYNSHGGALQWSIPAGHLKRIFLAGEQFNKGCVFYSCQQDETVVTGAISLAGETLWEIDGFELAAVSRTGNRLALYNDHILMACRSGGDVLWERKLPEGFRMTEALFNPQNSSLLLYGSDDGMNENLHYFNADGKILWKKKITDGALLSFTPEGNRIITSSWRHYKEDFSQMVFFDEAGEVFPTSLELGMRVERLLVSTSRRYIVVSGEDGYIDVIDLDEELARDNTNPSVEPPFYSPVATGLDKDQMAVTLFFNSDDALIPVSRLISQTESPQRAAIEELIRGPSRESALNRTISREGGIDVTFKKETGQLFLDLSPEAAQVPGSFQIISVLNSLRYTAGCLPGIKEIYLTVNKEPLEICGDDLVLEQPLEPYHWIDPLFFPVRVREHYYLLPREASDLEIERRDLCELLGAVVKQCRTFYFVPGDLDLIDVVEAGGVVTINLGPSFRMLFPENGGEEEHLQAALILDALFLTALENSDSYQAIINVEGENWIPPEGYPSLSFVIHESYYINPEF